jgi:hypothetical protein
MSLPLERIEALAPDPASLAAAKKLLKPSSSLTPAEGEGATTIASWSVDKTLETEVKVVIRDTSKERCRYRGAVIFKE